jgi:hypothetical protein
MNKKRVTRDSSCDSLRPESEPTDVAYASPHIPRRGAPQAPQGPGSLEVDAFEGPATEKTESS